MTRCQTTRLLAFIALVLLATTPPAWSGPYGDSLGKCLVRASTPAEKATLVRWMFSMMALHPDVQASCTLTPAQRTTVSKDTAQLFERLLTERCATEAREAIRYEGSATIQTSFSLLGQVAARELFQNPRVAEGLAELGKHLDEKKLNDLLGSVKQ